MEERSSYSNVAHSSYAFGIAVKNVLAEKMYARELRTALITVSSMLIAHVV